MKHKLIIATAIIVSLISCKEKNDYKALKKMDWLVGTWSNSYGEKSYTEVWKKENDSTFKGYSHIIQEKDTIFSEFITIHQRGDSLYYIVNVENQNEGESVSFILTDSENNKYVFENPEHDFPTKIVYHKINNDSIFAQVSGEMGGKSRTVDFPMKRQE